MVYENALMPGIEYRIKNAVNFTPEHLQHLIRKKASEYGIPVDFKTDYLATNRVFGLLGDKEEVTILFNPKTNERLRYVFQFNRQGTYLFIRVNKTNGFAVDGSAYASYEAVTSVISGRNHWYTIVEDILNELLS